VTNSTADVGARRRAIGVAAAGATVVAIAGGLLTELGPWYQALHVPPWKPPDWAFGPIWTVIFTCAAIAGLRAWEAGVSIRYRARLLALFAVNGLLNIGWSVFFFRLHRPDWALGEVVALWLSVAALLVAAALRSRSAALFLVPYLVWVSIAALLNLEIVRLNPLSAG
jgi:tryptophan-rich sensory protein